jgi:hypothetical protein
MPDVALEEYLCATRLCDVYHPSIRDAATKIREEAQTVQETVIKIFYFIRDAIPLAFIDPMTKASETLRIKKGSCLTKATLHVALLRSAGIPARFRVMAFQGNNPREWEGILPSFAIGRLPEQWFHYFGEVYLDGRWIKADATFDAALIPDIMDWDGESDVYALEEDAILADVGAFASIEEEARKLDALYRTPIFLAMNSYHFLWILNLYLTIQRFKNTVKRAS